MLDKMVKPDLRFDMSEYRSLVKSNVIEASQEFQAPLLETMEPISPSCDAFFAFSGLNLLVPVENQESDMQHKQRGSRRFFIVHSILSGASTLTS